MCGIVGTVGTEREETIAAMNARQMHRGPDDAGSYHDAADAVRLAMRRLAIIDVGGGRQPMGLVDDHLTVVFNGEIFNAPELRRELQACGRRFQTDHSDTEVLLHLYATEGEVMVRRLNGMFAFVIHDRRRHRLFGARDPLGIKPLHYALGRQRFAFASEIKSLAVLPWIDWDLNLTAIGDFFSCQAIPAPATVRKGVRKLPAGSAFSYDLVRHEFQSHSYWQPSFGRESGGFSAAERIAEVRAGFTSAVRRWTQSDVPVAIALSGGLDSTAVAAALARERITGIESFSLGFADAPELDERPLAAAVAHRFGLKHHEITIQSTDLLTDLDAMLTALDEPYAGGLPSWFVFKAMAGRFKVAMTGSGGDELFGNYGKWHKYASRATHARHLLHAWRRRGATWRELRCAPHGAVHYAFATEGQKRSRLFTAEVACHGRATAEWMEVRMREAPSRHWLDRVAWVDLQLQLPEEFLFMTDRFSMAHSIEARTPFLDLDFVRLVQSIPASERTTGAGPKGLLMEVVRDWLPPQILAAPKRGFVLPMKAWLRGRLRPMLREMTAPEELRRQGIFRPNIGETVIAPFLAGADHLLDLVWTIFMFQRWHQLEANRR